MAAEKRDSLKREMLYLVDKLSGEKFTGQSTITVSWSEGGIGSTYIETKEKVSLGKIKK